MLQTNLLFEENPNGIITEFTPSVPIEGDILVFQGGLMVLEYVVNIDGNVEFPEAPFSEDGVLTYTMFSLEENGSDIVEVLLGIKSAIQDLSFNEIDTYIDDRLRISLTSRSVDVM